LFNEKNRKQSAFNISKTTPDKIDKRILINTQKK